MFELIFNKFYLRIFLMLSIIFSIITMAFLLLFSNQFSKYALFEVNKFNQQKTLQTVDNFEFVINRLRTFAIIMYEDPDIHNWLFSSDTDPMVINAAVSRSTKMLATEPYIYRSYMINAKLKRIIDSQSGMISFENFDDRELLEMIMGHRPSYLKCLDYNFNGKSAFILIIPSIPSGQPSYGYLVLMIDKELIQNTLLQIQKNSDGSTNMVVIDSDGELLLGDLNEELGIMINARANDKIDGNFNLDYQNNEYMIDFAALKTQDWKVFFITPIKSLMSHANSFRDRILVFGVILLIAQFAVIFWNSRRTYEPISNLAEKMQKITGKSFKNKTSGKNTISEYNVIENGISLLVNNVNELNQSVREHRALVKTDYLNQWVNQGMLSSSVHKYINHNTKLLGYNHIIVIVIRIEAYLTFSEKYDFSSRKLIKFGIGNIVSELIGNIGLDCESVDVGNDHIVVLTGCPGFNIEGLDDALKKTRDEVYKWIQIKLVMAVSAPIKTDDNLNFVYEHVYELTMLKYIWGHDKVYEENDFEKYVVMIQPTPDEGMLQELTKAVKLGHIQEVAPLLDRFAQSMYTMTYQECEFQLTLSIYNLLKTFKQFTSIQNFEGIKRRLDEFDTLKEAISWLEIELLNIAENMSTKRSVKKKEETAKEMAEYISNNLYNPNLSVDDVADHVSFSAGYVRQIFKDVYDITLSDYILSERIDAVKRLLETTDWPVAEISKYTGFLTKSHFYTAFKKSTGMTPAAYKAEFKLRN